MGSPRSAQVIVSWLVSLVVVACAGPGAPAGRTDASIGGRDASPSLADAALGASDAAVAAVDAAVARVDAAEELPDAGGDRPVDASPGGADAGVATPVGALVTEILGQSQTQQWFTGGDFTLPRWQARIRTGSGLDEWSDSSFEIWDVDPVPTPGGARAGSGEIERVVVTVGPLRLIRPDFSHDDFVSAIRDIIATVRTTYPAVRQIVLQPLAGAPEGTTCRVGGDPVRTAEGLEGSVAAIEEAVGGDVVMGLVPHVADCGQFADSTGHLNTAGRRYVATLVEDYYGAP